VYGYAGNLLEINLDRGQVSTKELPPELARQYLGGIGFNARIVYDQVPAGTDALAPENVLVFSAGSLVGTPFPTAARVEASAKSPLTGGFGTSNSGSFWGARLKAAGYDSVIVKGRAERPVYISINNDRITVCDASALWGKDAWEVIDILKTRHYGAEVALIGPAGENLVRFASIENGYYDGWGRTGLGAVMGSKNLKAIVVQGTGSIVTADPVGLLNATRKGQELIKSASSYIPFSTYGTMNATIPYGNFNAISTHNFSRGTLPNWKETAGRQIVDTYGRRHIACQSCIIACGHLAQVTEGKYAGLKVKALEITPTASFSGNAGLDTAATIKAVELCQRYGVDMVGAGSLIAFATELYLKGIISKEDIGYELEFGNDEAAFKLLQDIVTRSGIGNILAEGTKRAASHFNGAKPYAMHVKGLELPMIDPAGAGPPGPWGC
jgi:aldehyde:ferredoxin oxidoreductase